MNQIALLGTFVSVKGTPAPKDFGEEFSFCVIIRVSNSGRGGKETIDVPFYTSNFDPEFFNFSCDAKIGVRGSIVMHPSGRLVCFADKVTVLAGTRKEV